MIQPVATFITALIGLFSAMAHAAPPSAATFFKKPTLSAPRLSPSGRHLAIQVEDKTGRQGLAVMDLETMAEPTVVAAFYDADVSQPIWLTERRLAFRLANSQDGTTRVLTPGLWAVDRDGSNRRQLILSSWDLPQSGVDRRLEPNWALASTNGTEDDEILVARYPFLEERHKKGVQFARMNTRTGITHNLSLGLPDGVYSWKTGPNGDLVALHAQRQGRQCVFLRIGETWQVWQEHPSHEFVPEILFAGNDGLTLVTDQHEGMEAVFKFDRATLTRDARPLLSAKDFDIDAITEVDHKTERLVGIHYEVDAPSTAWFDPVMKAHQAEIDARLPGSVNRISCGNCLSSQHLLVSSTSDQRPVAHYVYRVSDKRLQVVARYHPDLEPQHMGQRDYHRIDARDGLKLPVLVTQPAGGLGKRAHPTVVLVTGGLQSRNTHWEWEPIAQFLASRGFLVLEPEFRGSGGYGHPHFQAGWKQWGLAMQDDLADTLNWAIKKGWADAQRSCIVGGGYLGGYAALMGAVRQGDLFQCAVSWGGITDIGAMASMHASYFSEEWKRYGMKRLVADPATDEAQILTTSPLQRAKEITMPLLVAYGDSDGYVPLKHGTDFKARLRDGHPLEWVVYSGEKNDWRQLKTNEDFWGRVERFLARNIGREAKR